MKSLAIITLLFFALSAAAPLYAQGILPGVAKGEDCSDYTKGGPGEQYLNNQEAFSTLIKGAQDKQALLRESLGCALKLGRIRLFMIPFFITYLIQFLLTIAGLIAVLFVVIGGYRYVVGGLIEDKESGKKTIQNALIGLVVALSAWMVVNFIQIALTS